MIVVLILFIFVFNVISNLPKLKNKINLMKLDEIRMKIHLSKKFKKSYKIKQIEEIRINNNSLCIKNECMKLTKNITIKGGTIYV